MHATLGTGSPLYDYVDAVMRKCTALERQVILSRLTLRDVVVHDRWHSWPDRTQDSQQHAPWPTPLDLLDERVFTVRNSVGEASLCARGVSPCRFEGQRLSIWINATERKFARFREREIAFNMGALGFRNFATPTSHRELTILGEPVQIHRALWLAADAELPDPSLHDAMRAWDCRSDALDHACGGPCYVLYGTTQFEEWMLCCRRGEGRVCDLHFVFQICTHAVGS